MIDMKDVLSAILPPIWLDHFDVTAVEEREKEWRITLVEKEQLIPAQLHYQDAVLDGYMHPVELSDFPLRGKPTYLTFIRRRWKAQGSTEGVCNTYDFHPEGMKATTEFGAFLKDLDRDEADLLLSHRSGDRNGRKKDLPLVQGSTQRLYHTDSATDPPRT